MGELRLGDIIDDYCVKCKRIMNHAIVSMLNNGRQVRCRTCHSDHDYRHELPPPPKVDSRKQALFNEVLAKVSPGQASAPLVDVEADPDIEPQVEEDDGAEIEEVAAEPVAVKAAAKPKAKAAAAAKTKATKTKGRK